MQSSKNIEKVTAKKQPKEKSRCHKQLRRQQRRVKYAAQRRDDWKYQEAV